MSLIMRAYRDETDYWQIRAFLREVYLLSGRRQLSWDVCRWDYWRWHGVENCHPMPLGEVVFVWQASNGSIAALLNPDSPGEAFLQVHPNAHTPALEEEMLNVAEAGLAAPGPGGRRELVVWAGAGDDLRRAMLVRRGYRQEGRPEHQRRRPMSLAIPDAPLPAGYAVRALGGEEEHPARSWLSWQAFHPDEPDERYQGWQWYRNVQRAPLYRRDLDLVAVAPDGELASFCTVWFDDVTRTGLFEPVGTAPAHQQRGLGKAVMYEGLRRLQQLGATLATVGSYGPAAHALYASAGFTEYDLSEPWVKAW